MTIHLFTLIQSLLTSTVFGHRIQSDEEFVDGFEVCNFVYDSFYVVDNDYKEVQDNHFESPCGQYRAVWTTDGLYDDHYVIYKRSRND